ncbi:Glycosyltransferase family 61 protein [Striga hermonthica]|uniref:Glycosyltransferase family 61 protein n=1 Tax=Striga hermonthica TaxID=68872 RepID=A0A9N7NV66_STRHE|nr:Glycosyltransferase family 61 protein [Striga hermonthica]
MKDNTMSSTDQKLVFSRSFSRKEQKIFGCGALVGCLIVAVTFSTVFKSYLHPISDHFEVETTIYPSIRNWSDSRSDVYEITGDVRFDGRSFTIFADYAIDNNASEWTVKPYARKFDEFAMSKVSSLTVKHVMSSHKDSNRNNDETPIKMPNCDRMSRVWTPVVVFSTGGFSSNYFHAFTDVLLPLYSTSIRFGRDVLLVTLDGPLSWAHKYKKILDRLSKYDVISIPKSENHDRAFCFSRVVVGLRAEREFTANERSTPEFARLVRSAYSLKRGVVYSKSSPRSRMLIVCRRKGRRLVNRVEVVRVAQGLGFDVVMREMGDDMAEVARLVNGFDVMVAVHGAGLTNMVFLPRGAIVVQVVPYGLQWVARKCFEGFARSMKLWYLAYEAGLNESSLAVSGENPDVVRRKGWGAFKALYLDGQDLRVDLVRFRGTLMKAWELLHV